MPRSWSRLLPTTRAEYPTRLQMAFDKVQEKRYGENPHQSAASTAIRQPRLAASLATRSYRARSSPTTTSRMQMQRGNASRLLKPLACVIIKHANPCGVALGPHHRRSLSQGFPDRPDFRFRRHHRLNAPVDEATAKAVSGQFMEVLIAPSYTPEALALLAAKQNVRVLTCSLGKVSQTDFKRVGGGLLVQTYDDATIAIGDLKVVTKRAPTDKELSDLLFAWRVAKYVKSNAIVYCKEGMSVGVGAGQMSRVDSARIAKIKAENAGLSIRGCVVASDAFFPFRDGPGRVSTGRRHRRHPTGRLNARR